MTFLVRHGIAFRSALAVIGFTLLAGIFSVAIIGAVAFDRTHDDVDARLQALIDTVATTTSAACFVEDKVLARDIAEGLLKNSIVLSVVIHASSGDLARVSRQPAGAPAKLAGNAIRRQIRSPFNDGSLVGEIVVEPNQAEVTRLHREELFFIGSALFLQLVAIIVAAIFAAFRWIVLPMKSMSDQLHRMSNDQSGSLPIPRGHETTEIGRLVLDINELSNHLARARAQAESASRAKGEFLAHMSHEIRTPINAVVGMAHLALKTELTPKQRDYLEKIRAAGRHLLSLVNDILDFAKIEAGKLQLEVEYFRLAELIERIQTIAVVKAQEKGLLLSVEIDPAIPDELNGDAMRISQILLNYINNAIKFTERGGVVLRASLLERGGERCRIRFEVEDSGPGLSAEQQERLFRSFEQADVSTTRRFGGSGLGLAISKQLAELMGGEVGVSSAVGRGSKFWATIGVAVAPPGSGPGALPEEPEKVGGEADMHGLHILLAEDNPLNQQIARELLEELGATVIAAANGREALDWVRRRHFDCVLMDVRMPEMDGIEATRLIRREPQLAALPIIAMTANARTEDRAACLQAGMNDFLAKPVDPLLFARTLRQWLPSAATGSGASPEDGPPVAAGPEGERSLAAEIDRDVLLALTRHDAVKLRRLVAIFLSSTGEGIAEMNLAERDGDLAALARLGHRFKSSARSMGALHLADLMATLESSAKAAAPEIGAICREIADAWARIECELSADAAPGGDS